MPGGFNGVVEKVAVNSTIISIVTPSYNQGEYIEETINSVISQEGDFFIDYIIMDGGSSDDSVDIIKRYDELLKRGQWPIKCQGITYRWVSEKDRGQTDAINKGFGLAAGEITAWINSDDTYSPGAFSRITEAFRTHPSADFIYGDGDVIDERGNIQWEWLSRKFDLSVLRSYHFAVNDSTNYIMQQSVFWRKSVFEKIGYPDMTLHYGMDYEYWLRAGGAGLCMVHVPVKLGRFRMIRGTKSLSDPTIFWNERLEIFRRYNGAEAMAPFFTYYYYNKLLHNGFNADKAEKDIEVVFSERWKSLDAGENATLRKKAEKGYRLGLLKAAKAAFLRSLPDSAMILCRKAVSGRSFLKYHPSYLSLLLYEAMGRRMSSVISAKAQNLAALIHRVRYQRRYILRDIKGGARGS
jgi:glycosyltransferase involved in cell wall biosynthesis